MQKDNSTFNQKAALRRMVLRELAAPPVVMETHGGAGALYRACYSQISRGVVFEKDPAKCDLLARQRPGWAVYETNVEGALAAGAGAHLEINVLDLDPYGEPWPALRAFMESERPRAARLWLVVNDGLRQKVRMGGAWSCASLQPAVARFGNNLHDCYLDVCRWMIAETTEAVGYALRRFQGYYTGHGDQMTHYAALLEQG